MAYVLGSDLKIVLTAKVSYNKDHDVTPESGIRLIRFLLEHGHWSPFEHCVVAYEASKKDYVDLILEIDNPAVQVYYDGGFIFLSLRHAIQIWNLLPKEVKNVLMQKFPATTALIQGQGPKEFSMQEFLNLEKEKNSGKVKLIDKLELGTRMDYYTFVVECPIFVARQWMRHRFGSFNEVSRRYVSTEPTFYVPSRLRGCKNETVEKLLKEDYSTLIAKSLILYNSLIHFGVEKGLARIVLPQSTMTRFYWTVPRISLENFLSLRTHKSAQEEIRELAEAIKELLGW